MRFSCSRYRRLKLLDLRKREAVRVCPFGFTPFLVWLRRRFSASQSGFAKMIGVSVDTIQNWEQGRCFPTGPARVLLVVADRNPDLLISTLNPDADHADRELAFA